MTAVAAQALPSSAGATILDSRTSGSIVLSGTV
jgi:hypothetical protein